MSLLWWYRHEGEAVERRAPSASRAMIDLAREAREAGPGKSS